MRTLLILCLLSSFLSLSQTKTFRGTFDELQAEAKQKNKPYLVEFYATWCGYCKKFDREVMTDSSFYTPVNKHLLFQKINGEFYTKTATEYNVKGYPTFILFAPDGTILKKLGGYQTSEQFNKLFTQLELTKATNKYNFTNYRASKAIIISDLKEKQTQTPLLTKIYKYNKEFSLLDCEELIIDHPEKEDYIKYYYNYFNSGFNLKQTQKLYKAQILTQEEAEYIFIKNIQDKNSADRTDLAFTNLLLAQDPYNLNLLDTKAYILLFTNNEREAKDIIDQSKKLIKKSKSKFEPTHELEVLIKK